MTTPTVSTFRRLALTAGILFGAAGIANGHVILLAPNGGEVLQPCSTFQIRWTIQITHNLQNWDLWYSTTGPGGPWIPIALDLAPGSAAEGSVHTYDWTVPDDPSSTVRVRVRMDNSGTDYYDISAADLEILPGLCATNYCGPAVPNSSGSPGVITASGSNVAGDNLLTLTASDLPPNEFGYFLTSQTQGYFNPPGSSGFLCLSGSIGRFNQPGNIGQGPSFEIQVDLTAVPQPTGPVAVLPGDTWNFQAWYRDNIVGFSTSNFTDGVSILFE